MPCGVQLSCQLKIGSQSLKPELLPAGGPDDESQSGNGVETLTMYTGTTSSSNYYYITILSDHDTIQVNHSSWHAELWVKFNIQ